MIPLRTASGSVEVPESVAQGRSGSDRPALIAARSRSQVPTTLHSVPSPPRSLDEIVTARSSRGQRRRRTRSRWRRWLRYLGWRTLRWPLLAVAILLATAVVDVGVRYVPAIRALQQGRDAAEQARTLLVGDLSHIDRQRIDQADALLVSAAADFGANSSVLADGWVSLRRLRGLN
jgi:hypothetical protein